MKKKILVTGASGFLGRRVVRYYKDKYLVFAPSHKEMDICDEQQVQKVFLQWNPDIVIHCAAISDVGVCEKNPEASYQYNVKGMLHIAKVCKKINAICILCSSDQVYFGQNKAESWKEDDILSPGNVYGRDKLLAEQFCQKANPDCICLRLSWMYDTKTLYEKEHSDFIRTFMRNISEHKEMAYPVNDYRGLTDVNEVIANMEKLFSIPGGVYNFGSPNHKNMYETVQDVFEQMDWNKSLLQKKENNFFNKTRNITMNQEKINAFEIYFSDTTDGIVHAIRKWHS